MVFSKVTVALKRKRKRLKEVKEPIASMLKMVLEARMTMMQ